LNQADALVFQTEKQIEEFADKLTETDKTDLTEKVELLKESHKNQNLESVEKYTKELNDVWNKISSKLYENSQNQTTNENSDSKHSETQDVDFEEVK
jgi:molecular chaperone DnaK